MYVRKHFTVPATVIMRPIHKFSLINLNNCSVKPLYYFTATRTCIFKAGHRLMQCNAWVAELLAVNRGYQSVVSSSNTKTTCPRPGSVNEVTSILNLIQCSKFQHTDLVSFLNIMKMALLETCLPFSIGRFTSLKSY